MSDPTRRAVLQQLGSEIRQRRQSQGWSRAHLARELGVTADAVKHWELGRNAPRPEYTAQLLIMFGVSVWVGDTPDV